MFTGSLLSNPALLGLLLDKVRRKRLLRVSGEGQSLDGCESKSENLGQEGYEKDGGVVKTTDQDVT